MSLLDQAGIERLDAQLEAFRAMVPYFQTLPIESGKWYDVSFKLCRREDGEFFVSDVLVMPPGGDPRG